MTVSTTNTGNTLGPAKVVEQTRTGIWVLLEDGQGERVHAELALTFPCEPAPGDRLLVIGQDGSHYAIGVLSGSAPADLSFQGDVDVHAVNGTLTLSGDDGVEVDGPKITLRAAALRTFAESVTERADEAYRWAKGLLTVRAGEARRVVDGEDYSQSERTEILAKGTVKIDGKVIHLGQ